MIKLILILIAFPSSGILFGQDGLIKTIDHRVNLINRDTTLKIREFDAYQIYGHAYDGGGVIRVTFDEKGIKKIEQEIGMSIGRLTTMIYFQGEEPIKIVEREENFNMQDNTAEMDYTRLLQVFEAEIYVFNWKEDHTQIKRKGARNVSEGYCGLFEYEPLIEIVRKNMQH